jgi:hypothetical protein
MGCGEYPDAVGVPNNPDDQIGYSRDLIGRCYPTYSWSPMFESIKKGYLTPNNEYVLSSTARNCYYCSSMPGVEATCSGGCHRIACCSIFGHGYSYYRDNYKADPLQCCLNTVQKIGQDTCNPTNRDGSSVNCKALMKEYCKGNNLFSDQKCIQWCAENKDACNGFMASRCNDVNSIAFDPSCKEFCLNNAGMCDSGSRSFCAEQNPDPYCACLNSDSNRFSHNPVCQDGNCVKNGYKTDDMIELSSKGCSIMDCGVYLKLENVNNFTFADNNITQRCGQTEKTETAKNIKLTDVSAYDSNITANGALPLDSDLSSKKPTSEPVPETIPEPTPAAAPSTDLYVGYLVLFIFLVGVGFFIKKIIE